MKHIDKSPIQNTRLKPFLTCVDHTVSRETFSILIDERAEMLVTTPRPDNTDLGKYYESEDYISHSNSNSSLFNRVYLLIRNYTIRKKLELLKSFNSEGKDLLDIGAGTGDFLLACKNDGWAIQGVEPNKKANMVAEDKTGIKISVEITEILNRKFDLITMWHVLEHVPDLNFYISNLKKLLKANGTLVIAVPNYKSFDAIYYKENWAAYDVPRHLWHFSQKAIKRLFKLERMKVVKIIPMVFDSFYVSLLSEKYKRGRSNLLKAFYIGLKSNYKAKSSGEFSSLIYVIKNSENGF